MPGTQRERFAVSAEELMKLSPTASVGLVSETIRQLNSVVIDAAAERQALVWGHRLQTDYSRAVSHMLDLTQSDIFERASAHLARLTQILESVDLPAIAGISQRGVLDGLVSRLNTRIDTPEEFVVARREIEHLVELLSDAAEPLLHLEDDLVESDRGIGDLRASIEAAALGAEYLANRLREERPALATRYFDRSLSLTQSLAQIHADAPLRKLQLERPPEVIGAIQNVVLLVLPRWLGSVSALVALAGRRSATPTQAGQLDHELRKIVEQLKP